MGVSLLYATVEDWLGWRNKKSAYNSTALKKKHMAKMEQLESTAMTRRLTEINRRTMSNAPATRGVGAKEMQNGNSIWKVASLANGNVAAMFRRGQTANKAETSV